MDNNTNCIVVKSGNLKAVFIKDEKGWRPDWFYDCDTAVLRFKDHEWLSLGKVVIVTHAQRCVSLKEGFRFEGTALIAGCRTNWSVEIEPSAPSFFRLHATIKPDDNIELVEALCSFETPYSYDGTEHSTTIIGANPAFVWHGQKQITPPIWANPIWCYSRREAARQTYESHLPILIHRVSAADGSSAIHTSICANFNVCDFHDLYVTPTRTIAKDTSDYWDLKRDQLRGYKYIVGALNWGSSFVKDPNILVPPGGISQQLHISASVSMPGGSLDEWLIKCWQLSYSIHNDGARLAISSVHERLGASWKKAGNWLQTSLLYPGYSQMVDPEKGPQAYVVGTRPLAGWFFGTNWHEYFERGLLQMLRYRLHVLGQLDQINDLDALENKLILMGAVNFDSQKLLSPHPQIGRILKFLSILKLFPDSPVAKLAAELEQKIDLLCLLSHVESNSEASMGQIASSYAGLSVLMSAENFDSIWRERVLKVYETLQDKFWEFGTKGGKHSYINGGQPSASIFLRTAQLFAKAYSITYEAIFAQAYRSCINMAIGWGYHTYNGDIAEDFDFRGLSHACMYGRDQQADVPPLENSNLMMALAWLDIIDPNYWDQSWFDCLWLYSQTGLSQYPATRTTKRLWTSRYGRTIVPLQQVATEKDICKRFPYMSYENPYDQTLIATYQSTAGLTADMFLGGVLADAGPSVLCIVPRVARFDLSESQCRLVVLYNPQPFDKEIDLQIYFFNKEPITQRVLIKGHEIKKLTFDSR